ncbi:MAG TPA: ThuA domain-containing protein [Thermotogaceae bacterium]|nr:ThuA domain-containing protein [Thermotogaceae bacterium]
MYKILLITGGVYHDFMRNALLLVEKLRNDRFDFEVTEDLSHLNFKKLAKKDVVLLYTLFKSINEYNKKALLDFVEKGGKLLGLHSANASFLENHDYLEMIGSKFLYHPPKCRFVVRISKMHYITQGLEDFEIVDELYISEYNENVNILLETDYNHQKVPILYTKSFGLGKVVFFALGHDTTSILNRDFIRVFSRSLDWLIKE